jgi:hypothetical protein
MHRTRVEDEHRTMSMSYTIDPARQLVRTRAWGVLSTTDLQDSTSRLMVDPRFEPRYRSLVDLREVTGVSADMDALAQTAAVPLFADGVQRAIVASSDVAFGVARMYAAFAARTGGEVQVFRELGDAKVWLGLDEL